MTPYKSPALLRIILVCGLLVMFEIVLYVICGKRFGISIITMDLLAREADMQWDFTSNDSLLLRDTHRIYAINKHKNSSISTTKMFSGYIWPVRDQVNDDRIFNQLNFLQSYAKTMNFTADKLVLRIGAFNFNHLLWRDGKQHLTDEKCPITNCWFTSNQSLFRNADAVVISEFTWKDLRRFSPKPRHQVWVAQYLEPPHQRPLNARALGELVNWTASYRRDATIVVPYGKWIPVSSKPDKQLYDKTSEAGGKGNCSWNCSDFSGNCLDRSCLKCPICSETYCDSCRSCRYSNCSKLLCFACSGACCTNCSALNCSSCSRMFPQNISSVARSKHTRGTAINYAKGRTKKVAMFVSNCKDTNGRRRYAWELSKYIDVDVFGDCGSVLSCPRSHSSPKPMTFARNSCFNMLKRNYKFFLSFENSNCVGYITEKLHWNALLNDVIPIVMGARAKDYIFSAPPGSYIHVDDFNSPRELADYLKLLDSNDTLYNEYFHYKQHFQYIEVHDTKYWCRLCGLLHLMDDINYVTWYKDFEEWTDTACSRSKDGRYPWKTWKKAGIETSMSKELMNILQSLLK